MMKKYIYKYIGIFTAILGCFFITGNNITFAEASIIHDKISGTITIIDNDGNKFVIEDKNVGADKFRDGESLVTEESRGLYYNWGVNTGYDYDDSLPKYDYKTVEGWGGMEDNSDPYLGKKLSIEEQLKRQGPCSEGYHIPSIGEWISIMKAWCDYDKECSDSDYSYFYGEKVPYITMKDGYGERFARDLLLPRIGSRTQNFTDERDYSVKGFYWSSSNYNRGGPNFYLFEITDNVITHEGNGGYHAMPIRCFENKKDELSKTDKGEHQNGAVIQSTTSSKTSIIHDKILGTITIIDDSGNKFVIEDKNVGADKFRDGESLITKESRGLLYNRGINIGYDYNDPLPKYDDKNIEGWKGSEDNSDPYLGKKLSIEEQLKRQGPCKKGYHVPSIGEWISIMEAWCDYDKECSDSDYSYFYGKKMPYITMKDGYGERFAKDLLLPRIGSRTQSYTHESDYNTRGLYWSSSVYGKGPNYYLYEITDNVIAHEGNGGYHAMPIRCFENKKDELYEAYEFAYSYGITTSNNYEKAKMNSPLTRIAMAKMLSSYAINILGKKPDTSKGEKYFIDVTEKQNANYDNAVNLVYQLGIMGQGTNKFRPNDEVTRAEFATALSRMLYSTPDGNPYYTTHLKKLKQEGIITNDNPKIKEKRGYVMLMLMRSAMNK